MGVSNRSLVRLVSDQQPEFVSLSIDQLRTGVKASWTRYIIGVLLECGCADRGLNISVCSDVPMGRGLASSAALTVATAAAACKLRGHRGAPADLATLCQRVEHDHLGVRCGLLDPYTALHGKERRLLLLDCVEKSHRELILPPEIALIICDSGTDRQLSKSLYNDRRAECQMVAEALGRPVTGCVAR